jgi:hypothetical protein
VWGVRWARATAVGEIRDGLCNVLVLLGVGRGVYCVP